MPNANSCGVVNSPGGDVFIPQSTPRATSSQFAPPAVVPSGTTNLRTSENDGGNGAPVANLGTLSTNHRHYIADALKTQGVTLSQCAKKMGITVEEAERQVDPKCNLTLEQLFMWSEALEVPLTEILPYDSTTSDPIRNRALVLRIMKTARQIQNSSRGTKLEYMAETLVDQLLELVPEFSSVEAWPTVGKSRAAKSEGLAARRVDPETSRFIEENYFD